VYFQEQNSKKNFSGGGIAPLENPLDPSDLTHKILFFSPFPEVIILAMCVLIPRIVWH